MQLRPRSPFMLWNQSRGKVACRELVLADTSRTRLLGLLGRDSLAQEEGLLIRPSSGVHTFGMRFSIDVVALDGESRVLSCSEQVKPWRVSGLRFNTRAVLELAAGSIRRAGIEQGDLLQVRSASPSFS